MHILFSVVVPMSEYLPPNVGLRSVQAQMFWLYISKTRLYFISIRFVLFPHASFFAILKSALLSSSIYTIGLEFPVGKEEMQLIQKTPILQSTRIDNQFPLRKLLWLTAFLTSNILLPLEGRDISSCAIPGNFWTSPVRITVSDWPFTYDFRSRVLKSCTNGCSNTAKITFGSCPKRLCRIFHLLWQMC